MQHSAPLFSFSRVRTNDLLLFTKNLGVMLKSGIPLSTGIATLIDQTQNTAFKHVLQSIQSDSSNGQSLRSSLEKFPHVFDALFVNLVGIGEESGTLESTLLHLAEQIKKDREFRQKIISASLYPSIVVVAALVIGGGMSIFVLPKLIELFQSFGTELPLSTRILLGFAGLMKEHGLLILWAIGAFFLLIAGLLRNTHIRYLWQRFLLSLPFIGPLIQHIQLTLIFRNIAIMLDSGLPILKAIETQREATTNTVYKRMLQELFLHSEKGESVEKYIAKRPPSEVPVLAARMIGVGEQTGRLAETLHYLADFYEEEVDTATKNFSTVLEPILLLCIGLVVAFLALAIISPIYQFTGSIKR